MKNKLIVLSILLTFVAAQANSRELPNKLDFCQQQIIYQEGKYMPFKHIETSETGELKIVNDIAFIGLTVTKDSGSKCYKITSKEGLNTSTAHGMTIQVPELSVKKEQIHCSDVVKIQSKRNKKIGIQNER